MIKNRIEKNFKRLKSWSLQSKIEAYRLYDRDIPEYPYIVDRYGDFFVIYDRSEEIDKEKNHFPEIMQALKDLFNPADDKIVLKKREKQKGESQYDKLNKTDHSMVIRESQAQFKVNLHDYLDTGLFLDHRPMRQKIYKSAKGKSFLNLFCYTGSVSVFAALAGAKTTSVDMSATYIDWAKENFTLNNIPLDEHQFIQTNALAYLEEAPRQPQRFDMIFLDPPTFSNSKRMEDVFEVEKDQNFLVFNCLDILNPGGVLYFSNNKRKFKLSPEIEERAIVKDITAQSIPMDFHDQKIHRCFEIISRS